MTIENFDVTGLLEPQKEHAKNICQSLIDSNLAADISSTGTGKTFVSCAVARYFKTVLNRKFVVICPKTAIPQWEEVLKSFNLTPEFIINLEKLGRGNTKWYKYISEKKYKLKHGIHPAVEIAPFLRAELRFPVDWLVIIDEGHKCKGLETNSAGILFNLKLQRYTTLVASATLATTPLDMRAFGFACQYHDGTLKDFRRFAREAGALDVGKWGALYFDSENPDCVTKLKEIHNDLFYNKKIAHRLSREQFGNIFPKTQVISNAYDMGVASDRIQDVYNQMEVELAKLEERCENYKQHILTEIIKARRAAELLKVPTMEEMSHDLFAEGRSVILFVNYTDTIEALVYRLEKEYGKGNIGQIYGGRTHKQRWNDINRFNLDKIRFIVANLAAGGQSINLHDLIGNYGRASIINPSYSAIGVAQSCGRTDRANAKTDVFIRFLLASRTIEESVAKKVNDKKDFIDILNNGDLVPDGLKFRNVLEGLNV